ncbi:hypothetical protein Cl131_gp124 [Aphanizomenon phage vB_AphaS-CL131]|nr:hypothetical protein Cl131_gp124 [Aphanizomenon phage vB_AphaS-CL131]
MNVYFFSRHEAQDQMIADLGGTIAQQFKGTISNVVSDGDRIKFLEMPLGETDAIAHSIPKDAIAVMVAPIPVQESWLKAGISVLLAPQNRRETVDGAVIFSYSGLLRVFIQPITNFLSFSRQRCTERGSHTHN